MTSHRPFGFWTATALIVGGMIGSGIFLLPASLAPYGWWGVGAWVISIIGALSIAYTLARLTQIFGAVPDNSTFPAPTSDPAKPTPPAQPTHPAPHAHPAQDAGGLIAILRAILGPWPAVLIGWSYWVSTWAAVAAIALAATSYAAILLPALAATPLRGAMASAGLIWALTLLNLAGAHAAGRFQVATTMLKMLPLVAVIITLCALGLGLLGDDAARAAAAAAHGPRPLPGGADGPLGVLPALGAAVTLTLFALLGFESAGVAADRVQNPRRTIMRATMIGTAITGLLYIIVSSGIALTLPLADIGRSHAPFALFIATHFGASSGAIIAAFAAIAAIGALNGWVLIQGEVPLGMARTGALPGWFARVNQRDVPVGVLLASSTLASLLVLTNASQSLAGLFTFAATLTTCASLWLYLAICVGAIARRVALLPATVGLAFSLFAMWGAGWQASGLSLLLMATGAPLYWMRGKAG